MAPGATPAATGRRPVPPPKNPSGSKWLQVAQPILKHFLFVKICVNLWPFVRRSSPGKGGSWVDFAAMAFNMHGL